MNRIAIVMAVEKEEAGGHQPPPPLPHHFLEQKCFFPTLNPKT